MACILDGPSGNLRCAAEKEGLAEEEAWMSGAAIVCTRNKVWQAKGKAFKVKCDGTQDGRQMTCQEAIERDNIFSPQKFYTRCLAEVDFTPDGKPPSDGKFYQNMVDVFAADPTFFNWLL